MDLIKIENQDGRPVTSSRNVAEVFEKEHKHVLRDVESLGCSLEFRESNFGLSYYSSDSGQLRGYKEFIMICLGTY